MPDGLYYSGWDRICLPRGEAAFGRRFGGFATCDGIAAAGADERAARRRAARGN